MNNKILITGATGFVGKKLQEYFKMNKIEYISLSEHGDRKTNTKPVDLKKIKEIKSFINKERPNIVIHLAANVDLSRNYEVGVKCFENNTLATYNLIDACKEIENLRFIYLSTEEIYGNTKVPHVEYQTVNPPSPYAISKLAGENICAYYSEKYNFKSVILRVGTIYGPNQPQKYYLPQIVAKAIKGESIPINSGKKKRDYVFIDDVVNALVKAMDVKVPAGKTIFNIGGGVSVTLQEFIKKACKICKSSSVIVYGSVKERENEADNWLMNINKAKKKLKWAPATDLDSGIKQMVESFKFNK